MQPTKRLRPNMSANRYVSKVPETWEHGDKLRTIRKAKGLTQRQAADLIGVAEQAYGQWERNKQVPELRNLRKIIEELDAPPEAIGYGAPGGWELVPSEWISKEMKSLHTKIDHLTDYIENKARL